MGFGIRSGSGNGKVEILEEFPGRDLKCIVKFYLSDLVVGNGNGRLVSCYLAGIAGFIVKETLGW
tara:strand:+ start:350 stop:544 length:195 start_codon:yes stop_codon:yes gene_type:complete